MLKRYANFYCFYFVIYYLLSCLKTKILRQEKHDYLEEKKQHKLEELLKIAREEDKKVKKNKNNLVMNARK